MNFHAAVYPSQLALQLADLGILARIAGYDLRQLPLPRIQRVRTDPEALRDLRYRIPAFGDLGHRITPFGKLRRGLNSSLKFGFPIIASCPQN
ncbi:hypothetical protein GCM10011614_35320 [Novosphingobium colocasiae]|uniref:Uncharacterized protein n=1 Tax=Novosphingobium colocasiae TaxID=1256513 RepID=A0A918UL59_9SPHN|nr:hypothetical protein GCM10011614_35320 [Novosphingobium colocasiae]